MVWTSLDSWIVAAGMLSALSCALLGNYLVLQRLSMMGDAISHAVLPGLAVAFLLTGSRASLPMFLGAALAGVLTALFTKWVNRLGKVEESAAMGVVFTALFAVGLILLVRGADKVDLDPGCVLYGAVELVPLDTLPVFGFQVPRAVLTLAGVYLLDLLFVALFYKELRIASFDPGLADTLGLNAGLTNYLLMTLVAVTAVAAFETVGSILVIAMLIVPAAAAHLLTDRLGTMIAAGQALAVAAAAGGHVAALTVPGWFGFSDTNTAGMMAAVAGFLFLLAMLLAPRHGILARLWHRGVLALHVIQEDLLGFLCRCEELPEEERPHLDGRLIRRVLGVNPGTSVIALLRLQAQGRVIRRAGAYALSESGRRDALLLVRTHRLWESYLHHHLNLPADHLHPTAARLEHVTTPAMRTHLAERTGQPTTDPHGRAVPPEDPG